MKPQELRIGNFVTDEWFDSYKKFITVEDINSKGINLSITDDGNWSELAQHFITPEYELSELRGIPLTEEILVKCGFEINKDYVSEDHLYHDYILNGVRIQLPYFDFSHEDGDYKVSVKSLHQLQNLYFSLTGEELKIEL